jgi:hypothetical protein
MPVGFGVNNSNPRPVLVAIVTNNAKPCLCVTPDYKNWYMTGSILKAASGSPRGVAYSSSLDRLYTVTTEAVPNAFKGADLAGFRTPNAMTATGAYGTSTSGNRLFVDEGRIMYGANNSICHLSTNNGQSWITRNTWGSSATRQPSVVRYFSSVQKYINGMVTVTVLGRTTTGGAFASTWSGDTSVLADPGWGSTTGRVRHIEEGSSGNFVIVGRTTTGKVSTSSDLDNWTNRSWVSNDEVFFVAWNGSMWVAVGANGVIGTSTDTNAATWTSRTSPISTTLVWVGWDSNIQKWIAVSSQFEIITSSNGIEWSNNSASTTNFRAVDSIMEQLIKVRNI